jgi:hypothetical protein
LPEWGTDERLFAVSPRGVGGCLNHGAKIGFS